MGWEVKNVVKSLKACGSEVTLTLRVSNSSLAGHDEDIDNSTLSIALTNTETNKITKPKGL